MSDANEMTPSREPGVHPGIHPVEDKDNSNRQSVASSVNSALWHRPLSVTSSPILSGLPPSGPSPSQPSSLRRRASSVNKTQEESDVNSSLESKTATTVVQTLGNNTGAPVGPSSKILKLSHEPVSIVLKSHLSPEEIQSYMVYTHTQPIPKKWKTIREYRSIFRLLQTLTSAGAFATIFYSSIANSHQSFVLTESGVSLMCLTSISAFLIAFTFVIVYLFPHNFNITPHRHPRFSITEVILDLILIGLWLASSSVLLLYGRCSTKIPSINHNEDSRTYPEWIPPLALGYLATLLCCVTCGMGLVDLYGQWVQEGNAFHAKDHIMFARGDWKD